jgi:soluble lytic murein transglycosylase
VNTRALVIAFLLLSLGSTAWAAPSTSSSVSNDGTRHSGSAHTRKKPVKKSSSRHSKKRTRKRTAAELKRLQRMNRAFVASTDLRPMARQLLDTRSRAAYGGVESYARRHVGTDTGSMAYLALGYAHYVDRDYPSAIAALKKAQPRAGDLGDYVSYFLASSYSATGDPTAAADVLQDFSVKYPESVFLRDAAVTYANALVAGNDPAGAIAALRKYREPARPDMELVMGRALMRTGDREQAISALKHIYLAMPTTGESAEARTELANAGYVLTFMERREHADGLAAAKKWSDAAREYRDLAYVAQPADKYALTVALGVALHHSGSDAEARRILESLPESSDEANAQRMLALAEMARASDDLGRYTSIVDRMRQISANTPAFQDALILGGNMYLLRKDYDKAIDYYREAQTRFPTGNHAPYAHWKAAWLTLRQGRNEEAKRDFEKEIALYPMIPEAAAAMYWRGRLAEEDHDYAKARAYYNKLDTRFRNYYYAVMARARLELIGPGPAAVEPVLAAVPPLDPLKADPDPPDDDLRVQKAMLLANAGLVDFAARELRAADDGQRWSAAEIAKIYVDYQQYHRALQIMKHAIPSYFALDLSELPRDYWETLFPRPYWTDLKRFATNNELDPYLVASLIRQESEFNPGAVSRSEALGLMQLLPVTGRQVARQMNMRRFSQAQLLSPTTNLQLGTRYFRELVDKFGGQVEYALAAYNAGPDRVESWLTEKYRDPQEFVESIPFTETREYVQAIMRNAGMYRQLYSDCRPGTRACAAPPAIRPVSSVQRVEQSR